MVLVLGFRVNGLGARVQVSGFMVDSEIRVQRQGSWFRVQGSRFRV